MTRRSAGAVLALCAFMALCAACAAAEVPTGPRLTFMRGGDRGGQLVSSDPTGNDQQVLVPQGGARLVPFPWSPPSWAADGSRVAFDALANRNEGEVATYVVGPDGSGPVEVPGTEGAIYPVLSLDGRTLAFAREKEREAYRRGRGKVTVYRSISVWLTGVEGGPPRHLPPWRKLAC